MPRANPHRVLKTLFVWSAITFVVFWLPTVRGLFDGSTYAWSAFGFSGRGTGGDYWFPLAASTGAIAFLFLAARGAGPTFQVLLVTWHLFLAGGALHLALTEPNAFRFRGDTLGIDVSLAWIGPLLFGGFALLAILWVIRMGRFRRWPPVESWRRPLGWLVIALLPAQFLLLRMGRPDGRSDQIGVLLTVLQWGLITAFFYPLRAPRPTAPLGGEESPTV